MIKTIFRFFQMQTKSLFRNSVELLQPSFAERPKTFYPINVRVAINELVSRVIDAQMLTVADINQSVVAAPLVRVDTRIQVDTPANNGLQRLLCAVRFFRFWNAVGR